MRVAPASSSSFTLARLRMPPEAFTPQRLRSACATLSAKHHVHINVVLT